MQKSATGCLVHHYSYPSAQFVENYTLDQFVENYTLDQFDGNYTLENYMEKGAPSGQVKRGELWYHLFGSTQNEYLSNHKVVCRCDFRPHV